MKTYILNLSGKIKEAVANTFRVCMREYQLIFTDLGVVVLLLVVPVVYPVLYSFIYYPEVVHDLPVSVVDLSHSPASRDYIRSLNATPEVKIEHYCLSMEEAIVRFKKGQSNGIVVIPENFSNNIATGQQAVISVYADMKFFLHYKAIMMGSAFVTLQKGSDIQIERLMAGGLSAHQADIQANPILLNGNAMANSAGGFASYGIPAALMLIIQQTLVLSIGILAGTARERHAGGLLVPPDRRRIGTLRLVVGKSAAYFTIYLILSVYMLAFIPRIFGYPQMAGAGELSALLIPYLLSAIFMGMTLSVLFKNRESPMLLYLFASFPLLFLSGIIWPLSNMGPLWLAVREIFPSSNAMYGFIKMNTLGAGISETRSEIMALWVQSGIYFLMACLVYWKQVKIADFRFQIVMPCKQS
ncbi:MAG: ABC transporter permease [Lentimicrobiaceae bacterium]|jgi:ABC-2 type transport system permease protein|nr:ABC transporter permease [Lentimicrobiaceae bacterium]